MTNNSKLILKNTILNNQSACDVYTEAMATSQSGYCTVAKNSSLQKNYFILTTCRKTYTTAKIKALHNDTRLKTQQIHVYCRNLTILTFENIEYLFLM